jgi:hypothetical protein
MPLNTTSHTLALHKLGTWQLLEDTCEVVTSGWDTQRQVYGKYVGTGATARSVAAQWHQGQNMGGNFWLTEVTPRALGGGIWGAECVSKGLSAPRPPRYSGGAASLQRSIENLSAFGQTYPKAEVWESTPTLEVEFISFTPPRTQDVGTEETPINAPPVRPSAWSSILDPTFHFPNGWVIADVRYEQILNLNVWLITMVYEYRYPFTP